MRVRRALGVPARTEGELAAGPGAGGREGLYVSKTALITGASGGILNLASTAAFVPGPLMAVYYASKAYVLSFSQALANELQGTGVTVTALAPGPTRTGFQKRGVMEDSRLVKGQIADAASVALAGYRGLMSGKTLVIPGFANKLIPWVGRLSPRGMVTRVVRRLQERVPH